MTLIEKVLLKKDRRNNLKLRKYLALKGLDVTKMLNEVYANKKIALKARKDRHES